MTPGLMRAGAGGSTLNASLVRGLRALAWGYVVIVAAPVGAQSAPAAQEPAPAVGRIFESTAAPAPVAAAAPSLPADSRLPAVIDRGLLVDRRGMTLYTFDGDRRPRVSTCYGICETLWPPLYATPDDQPLDEFTIAHRRDGSLQWTYRGKPLYYWKRDRKPGDITGDRVNNVWHVVRADAGGAQRQGDDR
jgi:predicted lipoprotein with Yx(FWY)xxD motif